MYIYVYIYTYLYLYIYIYRKKERGLGMRSFQKHATFCVLSRSFAKERCILCVLLHSLQKNVAFFAFFYILCKRMLRSLRSFTFLRKERKRTQKNASFLLDFISRQKLEKRTQKNVAFRRKRTRCLTLRLYYKENVLCSYTWKIMNRNLYEPE